MKFNLFLLLIIGSSLMVSCDKEANLPSNEELIFGLHSPFCRETCTKLFLLKDGHVYPQEAPKQTPAEVSFSSQSLDSEKEAAVMLVLDQIPDNLFNAEGFLGCPGCADETYLYLKKGDSEMRIDLNAGSTADEVASWTSALIETLP